MAGSLVRIVDAYENSKEGLEHYVKVIQSKDYVYGRHIAPHDIQVKEWGTGMTRLEKARQLGINFTIAPDVSIMDGIEAVRSKLGIVFMDQVKCSGLIKALENYRQEYDPKNKVYKSVPLHNWASHYADAMRYLCISLPKIRDSGDPQELDKRYHQALMGEESNLPPVFRNQRY